MPLLDIPAVLMAAVPPVLWLLAIASRDRFEPEPARMLVIVFAAGIGAAFLALLPNELAFAVVGPFAGTGIVAPINEEVLKLALLFLVMRRNSNLNEPVDGLVYGSAIGLGFAAGENVGYVLRAFDDPLALNGVAQGLLVIGPLRAISSTVMHAVATGISGWALGLVLRGGRPRSFAWRGLAAAIAVHATYNSSSSVVGLAGTFGVLILAAIAYALLFNRASSHSPFAPGALSYTRGRTCPSCGGQVPDPARHCPQCGVTLDVPDAPSAAIPGPA